MNDTEQLKRVAIWVCEPCLKNEPGECHYPGCIQFLRGEIANQLGERLDFEHRYEELPTHPVPTPVDGELPSSVEDVVTPHLTEEEYAELKAKVPDLDLTKPWDILTAYGRACDTRLAAGLGRPDCVSLILLWGHYAYLKGRRDSAPHLQAAIQAARIEENTRYTNLQDETEATRFEPCNFCGQVSFHHTCDQALIGVEQMAKRRLQELKKEASK